jgi:hypothetical protein
LAATTGLCIFEKKLGYSHGSEAFSLEMVITWADEVELDIDILHYP